MESNVPLPFAPICIRFCSGIGRSVRPSAASIITVKAGFFCVWLSVSLPVSFTDTGIDTAQVFSAAMAGNANNNTHQKSRTMANTKIPPFWLSTIFSTTILPVPVTLSFCMFFCFILHLLSHIFSSTLFHPKLVLLSIRIIKKTISSFPSYSYFCLLSEVSCNFPKSTTLPFVADSAQVDREITESCGVTPISRYCTACSRTYCKSCCIWPVISGSLIYP